MTNNQPLHTIRGVSRGDYRLLVASGVYVATDPRWGYDGGQDIGPACNAAIAAMSSTGGKLYIPPAPSTFTNWITTQRINLKTGVEIEGSGRNATQIRGTVDGVFGWASHMSQWAIRHLKANSYAGHLMTPAAGGDYSISQGTIDNVWWTVNDITKSIFHHDSNYDYIMVKTTNSRFDRLPTATVPAWYIRNAIGAANSNIWENLWAQSYNCTTGGAFFFVESTAASSYAYDNTFRGIIGEQNRSGLIEVRNAFGGIIEECLEWDAVGAYTGDIFKVTNSPSAPTLRSRYFEVRNSGRRGGSLDPNVYDINLAPGASARCVVVAQNHSSEPTSGLRINMSKSDGHTMLALPPSGSVWPGQPSNAGSFFGPRVEFNSGIYVGASLKTTGTGSPEGVVTGSVGDEYVQTDGAVGSVKWVKEVGAATNTGWRRKGQSLPKMVRSPQYRHLLSGKPYPGQVGTGTWAKDNWRFMPLSLDEDLPLAYLGTIWSTAASGGTAAMIFALYGVNQYGQPTTLQADTEQLLATSGLIVPAGDWCIAAAWSGTATVSPVVYTTSGCHPRVGANAIGQNAAGWQQSVSGVSAPYPAVASAAVVPGIAIYGVLG